MSLSVRLYYFHIFGVKGISSGEQEDSTKVCWSCSSCDNAVLEWMVSYLRNLEKKRYVVKTLDNAESVKLQYRSLEKLVDDQGPHIISDKAQTPNWL
ncbi:hypothetical protein BHE74_00017357 [Ensete ventricosum]|nr:hypothetical protein GW17_00025852 [Ensete ventricosum]RWW74707.1 hypothetical protein BHE74_00017357 [Ensete ventricosum]